MASPSANKSRRAARDRAGRAKRDGNGAQTGELLAAALRGSSALQGFSRQLAREFVSNAEFKRKFYDVIRGTNEGRTWLASGDGVHFLRELWWKVQPRAGAMKAWQRAAPMPLAFTRGVDRVHDFFEFCVWPPDGATQEDAYAMYLLFVADAPMFDGCLSREAFADACQFMRWFMPRLLGGAFAGGESRSWFEARLRQLATTRGGKPGEDKADRAAEAAHIVESLLLDEHPNNHESPRQTEERARLAALQARSRRLFASRKPTDEERCELARRRLALVDERCERLPLKAMVEMMRKARANRWKGPRLARELLLVAGADQVMDEKNFGNAAGARRKRKFGG